MVCCRQLTTSTKDCPPNTSGCALNVLFISAKQFNGKVTRAQVRTMGSLGDPEYLIKKSDTTLAGSISRRLATGALGAKHEHKRRLRIKRRVVSSPSLPFQDARSADSYLLLLDYHIHLLKFR